jgi:hypothetical protein
MPGIVQSSGRASAVNVDSGAGYMNLSCSIASGAFSSQHLNLKVTCGKFTGALSVTTAKTLEISTGGPVKITGGNVSSGTVLITGFSRSVRITAPILLTPSPSWTFNASACNLPREAVDALLADFQTYAPASFSGATIILSGDLNSSPSAAGLDTKDALELAGAIVIVSP